MEDGEEQFLRQTMTDFCNNLLVTEEVRTFSHGRMRAALFTQLSNL